MKREFKRVMAVHDLSGLGRSSLMAITPVLSVMGVQVCPVPTAVLSTQTSGFTDYTFIDLTDTMPAYLKHWQQLHMDFDCIYSGFLGSAQQIALMENTLDTFVGADTLVVIDPVLGDDNALYDTMDDVMVQRMVHLISRAHIITPNVTEVKLLLGLPLDTAILAEDLEPLTAQLSAMGPETVIVTGVHDQNDGRCVCCYQRPTQSFEQIAYRELPVSYPGTGDIFTAVLIGGLLQSRTLQESVKLSADFICHAVEDAIKAAEPVRDEKKKKKNLYRLCAVK